MSLIHCTDPCVYQRDGLCELVRAGSLGRPGSGCVNFVPVASQPLQQRRQGLPDVGHPDELQPLRHHQLPLGALGVPEGLELIRVANIREALAALL